MPIVLGVGGSDLPPQEWSMLVLWETQRGCTAVMPYSSTLASCLVCFSLLCAAPELGQHLVCLVVLLPFCDQDLFLGASCYDFQVSECVFLARVLSGLLPLPTCACNQGGHHVAARTVATARMEHCQQAAASGWDSQPVGCTCGRLYVCRGL